MRDPDAYKNCSLAAYFNLGQRSFRDANVRWLICLVTVQNRCHVSPAIRRSAKRRRYYSRAIRRERHVRATAGAARGATRVPSARATRRKRALRERSLRGTCYTTVTNLVTVRCAHAADKALSHDDWARSVSELLGCHRMPITDKIEESFYVIVCVFFFLVSFESFSIRIN